MMQMLATRLYFIERKLDTTKGIEHTMLPLINFQDILYFLLAALIWTLRYISSVFNMAIYVFSDVNLS